MLALAASVLVTSLIGSPHCGAMCGGFVGLYASRGGSWLPHVAYNAGRLASYLALGVAAGLAGAGIEKLGGLAGVSRAAAILAGVLMVIWGGASLWQALASPSSARARRVPRMFTMLHRVSATVMRAVDREPAGVRAVTIGLLSTLLPCGWLYAFVAVAAGTGTPAGGATVMLAFWIGTLPVMTGLAVIARVGLERFGRRMPVVTAIVIIAIGLLTLAGRMNPGAHAGHAAGAHSTHSEHADHGAH
jgi:hypothetical protein